MVLYAAWFIWRHILPYEGRRAAWVLDKDPQQEVVHTLNNLSLIGATPTLQAVVTRMQRRGPYTSTAHPWKPETFARRLASNEATSTQSQCRGVPCLGLPMLVCLLQGLQSRWWSKVLDVVVGPKGVSGKWMALKRRDSRFVNKYGPLFDANRGPPMVLTDCTYEVDPKTGFCNRGRLQQVHEAPIFSFW